MPIDRRTLALITFCVVATNYGALAADGQAGDGPATDGRAADGQAADRRAADGRAGDIATALNQSIGLLRTGHPDQAVESLRESLTRFGEGPEVYQLHFELANAYGDKGDYPSAISEYKKTLELRPDYSPAVVNIAFAYVNSSQFDEAIPCFQRYLVQNPAAPNSQIVQSQLLIAQAAQSAKDKRYFDAKNFLEKACQLNPTYAPAHFKLARACDELGDTNRAIHEYQEALRYKPDYWAAAFNIAGCYQTLGQVDQSAAWFERYLDMYPNCPDRTTVLNMIAKLKEHRGLQADPRSLDYMQSITERGQFVRWPANKIPIKVYISNPLNMPAYSEACRNMLIDAIFEWSKAAQGRLKFQFVRQLKRADIVCDWTNNPFDVRQAGTDVEQGICVTQVVHVGAYPPLINHATIRILLVDPVNLKPLSDDSMKVTCLHEFGHSLGLRGHSSNNHDVMFYSVSPTVWPVLSKRDKSTLFHLYESYPAVFGDQ